MRLDLTVERCQLSSVSAQLELYMPVYNHASLHFRGRRYDYLPR